MAQVNTVVVVGGGAMGSQIGMVCALSGFAVNLQDVSEQSLDRARTTLRQRMDRDVEKGRRTSQECEAAFDRMHFGTDLEAAAGDADFAIEAAAEDLDIKQELFGRLDRLCPQRAILASNSSSFVPSKLASATGRPDRVCNMHFFNPALVMKCVEVVRGPESSDEAVATTVSLAEDLGKQPVVLDKEINGFVANRIVGAIRDEALFLLEGEYASVEAIDAACRTALGHPMGPFELQDLTGLDIGHATKRGRYDESGDPADAPQRSLAERVEAGHLGRKTGQGWYRYDADGNKLGEAPSP